MKLEIVCATRYNEADFWSQSALGRALSHVAHDKRIATRIYCENRTGLPELYNASIDADNDHEVLLFIHDDVWIQDYFFVEQVFEAVEQFDIVGVVGNRQRTPNQTTWVGIGEVMRPNVGFLSGTVGQGPWPLGLAHHWGPAPAECEFLDGFFLATRKATLRAHGLRFDPQFDFHFYDMDLCSSARQKNLRLGTWRISLTHQSNGNYDSDAWRAKCALYLKKWGSPR